MHIIKTLVVAYIRLIKNQYINIKNTLLLFAFHYFLFGGIGYLLFMSFQYLDRVSKNINLFDLMNNFFLYFIVVTLVTKQFNEGQLLIPFKFNKLLYFPIPLSLIIIIDTMTKFFNKYNVAVFGLFCGFSLGFIYGSPFSNCIIFFLIMITFVFIFHLLTDILHIFFYYNSIFPKYVLLISITTSALFFYAFKNLIILKNPVTKTINSIYILSNPEKINILFNVLILNIAWFLFLFVLVFYLKYIIAYMQDKNASTSSTKREKYSIYNLFYLIFPSKVSAVIIKDIKYIIRSTRGSIFIVTELLVIIVIFYFYFHSTNPNKFYFAVFISTFSIYPWESYLNNQWGFEKSAFGFYLFSPIDPKLLVLSKNLSFFIIKFPFVLLSSLAISFLFDIKLIIHLLILNYITIIIMLIFTNFTSIKSPYQLNIKEKLFAQGSKESISWFAFSGLLVSFLVVILLIMILWLISSYITSLIIFFSLLFISIMIYIRIQVHTSNYFSNNKEKIYREMISS